ncbi:MAG: hemerythrin family protein [Deltaproteobacteria bacterium]
MIAEWWDDLATSNELIDSQHKELFKRINSLLIACEARKGEDEIGNLLQFLTNYVKTHFSDEEALQLKTAYPLYKEHRIEHDAFIAKLILIENQFKAEGPSFLVTVNAGKMALQWLVNHIYLSDKKMAEFINNTEQKFPSPHTDV